MESASKKEKNENLRRNEEKWTPTLMKPGYTLLPSVLLEHQRALDLDAVDVNIILHLVRHWWFPNALPHPSKKTIADCMNIDPSTVRRHIAALEKRGFLKREARFDKDLGQTSNVYRFDGLINAAVPYAEEMLRIQEQRREEDAARRTRGHPKLEVVNSR